MRNRYASSFMLAFIGLSLAAEAPAATNDTGWLRDVDRALQVAAAQRRPLLLFISMDRCSYCRKMIKTTLSDRTVREQIGAGFVAAAIKNSDRPDIMRQLGIRSFPTTLVIDPDGRILHQMNGYVDARKFREQLAQVTNVRPAATARATQPPAPVRRPGPASASRPPNVSKPKSAWPFDLGRVFRFIKR